VRWIGRKKVYGCQCLYGGTKCSNSQSIHGRNYLQNFGFQEWPASSEKCRVLFCPRYKPFKTLRRHTRVNLTLRRDVNVRGKDAYACCRSSVSRSLNVFNKSGPILKVALLPYHRSGGASWNPDFYNGVGLDVFADQSPDSFKRASPSAYLCGLPGRLTRNIEPIRLFF